MVVVYETEQDRQELRSSDSLSLVLTVIVDVVQIFVVRLVMGQL